MATTEERMTILRMIEQGKISPEEGARLLKAMGQRTEAASQASPGDTFDTSRTVNVRVTEISTGRRRVNVNIPVGLVRLVTRWLPAHSQIDLHELEQAIESGVTGRLMEVVDQEHNARVEIFLS